MSGVAGKPNDEDDIDEVDDEVGCGFCLLPPLG
jgi:hypothetical protein